MSITTTCGVWTPEKGYKWVHYSNFAIFTDPLSPLYGPLMDPRLRTYDLDGFFETLSFSKFTQQLNAVYCQSLHLEIKTSERY